MAWTKLPFLWNMLSFLPEPLRMKPSPQKRYPLTCLIKPVTWEGKKRKIQIREKGKSLRQNNNKKNTLSPSYLKQEIPKWKGTWKQTKKKLIFHCKIYTTITALQPLPSSQLETVSWTNKELSFRVKWERRKPELLSEAKLCHNHPFCQINNRYAINNCQATNEYINIVMFFSTIL